MRKYLIIFFLLCFTTCAFAVEKVIHNDRVGRKWMLRVLVLIFLLPIVCFAKEEITYPDKDTAIRNGVKYKRIKEASIYKKIDEAK
jgi:hypothetical protein